MKKRQKEIEKTEMSMKKSSENIETEWVNLKAFNGEQEFCGDDEPIRNLVRYIKRSLSWRFL